MINCKIPTLLTPRTKGDRPREEDIHPLSQLWSDRRVSATLSATGDPFSPAEIQTRFDRFLDHWQQYRYGVWWFRDRYTSEFIGYCGLRHVTLLEQPELEILYAIHADYWGRGMTTEMAAAVLEYAIASLHQDNLIAYTLTTNYSSQRVMQKIGMKYERDFLHVGLPHQLYRYTWSNLGGNIALGSP